MFGLTLSILIVTDPLPVKPSRSVADAVFTVPFVFGETLSLAGVGPDATPEPTSLADQLMVTLLLFQPAAFGAGDTPVLFVSLGNNVGGLLSRIYEAVPEPGWPPQLLP